MPGENLRNPVKKGNKKDAYTNFLNDVKQFQEIDSLAAVNLKEQNWKKKRSSDSTETSSRGKRQRLNSEVCFLCEKQGSSRR